MANILYMKNPRRRITWRIGNNGDRIYFTLKNENNNVIAKSFLTVEQLHQYICNNDTTK